MSSQVATSYGASRSCPAACLAKLVPRSRTSGARSWPFWLVTALSSSWLEPAGPALLIFIFVFYLDVVLLAEGVEHLLVVRPARGQCDDVELALLLGGGDQGVHAAEILGRGRGRCVGAAAATGAAAVRAAGGEGEPGRDQRERGPQGASSHMSS